MPNQLSRTPEGFVLQVLDSDLTAESLRADLPKILELKAELARAGKPLRVLIDSSRIKTADSATRKAGVENLNEMGYDKIAIFGVSTFLKTVVNFVLHATGKTKKIRGFKERADAESWLKQG